MIAELPDFIKFLILSTKSINFSDINNKIFFIRMYWESNLKMKKSFVIK